MRTQMLIPAHSLPPLALESVKHQHLKASKSRKGRAQSRVRIMLHLFSIPVFQKNRVDSGADTLQGWSLAMGLAFHLPGHRAASEAVVPLSPLAPQLGEGRKLPSNSCT